MDDHPSLFILIRFSKIKTNKSLKFQLFREQFLYFWKLQNSPWMDSSNSPLKLGHKYQLCPTWMNQSTVVSYDSLCKEV